ncbi:hypothetical protein [Salinimonas sediminis]|nr:hypothetical protein [Salinimonas sediminis]
MLKKLLPLCFAVLMAGCSSSSVVNQLPGMNSSPSIEFSKLYLRGVFNWWEASAPYRLNEGDEGWYTDIELIADGQPYDFKVSDKVWTPAQTCGAKYQGQHVVALDTVFLVCGSDAQNLQFTPTTTDTYRFTFASASGNEIRLTITRTPD